MAAKLVIEDGKYLVGERELTVGMVIRRYDWVAPGDWFEGRVDVLSSYGSDEEQRVPRLCLVVEGYAPSPLQAGDEIEIVAAVEDDEE